MSKKSSKNGMNVLLTLGAIAGAAAVATISAKKFKNNSKTTIDLSENRNNEDRQVYFIGGGLASLAGAAYLVRDCNFKGENIHIIEGMKILGGSNDGAGDAINGYVCRGGRMLNEETYENFWELFSGIPSLDMPGKSVKEEILNFDHLHPTHAQARLIDKDGVILDVTSMGFNNSDRMALGKLMITSGEKLDNKTIEEWFSHTPHFFETNFWYMWQTTFAFQKWSSLFEFKRYMERMIFEFSRIETLEGVTRTQYNQYESVILPLKAYLDNFGVDFSINATVTDLDFKSGDEITVTAMHIEEKEGERVIQLNPRDVCIMTNGCMTDCATLGDMYTPAEYNPSKPISGELWAKIAKKKRGLGNPEPFFGHANETNWESFTVTCKGNKLLNLIEKFSTNIPGSGALMTFKDSNWLMSIVVAAQPHFKNQPIDTTMFWGYSIYTDKVGDFVKKSMRDCTGEEMLIELLHHMHMEDKQEEIMDTIINVIPCMMPYVDAQFQPRKMTDRPSVVPECSTNFAMISQFVEIPEDMVFTEEYSVRAARIAIYTLFDVKDKTICPVTPYRKNTRILKEALKTSFR
ncbi:oleate hydratase [Clostridium sp. CM028]|uniref:oleate hydratase n=1 Tax=unclassified Clostridium TaxID=2614128 RepID=UPI001C0BA56B|nr:MULTISPECIES: oleate hydratase [unclassified Clostridium]MBU3092117.1 oleate hydratase [Clostridium sp. CF011]MBW9146664.1 oleate hydratase [Clostridium sp. CM027]MBW9149100.1 oleate hydratase [Clostridium sp. CM028]UVE42015.1 oleate hydratase [Clostridium sp. CM027]WAG71041.1 oleate hydratase [Clostridium sp. CF011]